MGADNESALHQQVQTIKDNDDLMAHLSQSIAKVAGFLSALDVQTRTQMALMNEQLEQLDKTLEFLETRVEGTVSAKKSSNAQQHANLGLNADSSPRNSHEYLNEASAPQQSRPTAAIPPPPPPPPPPPAASAAIPPPPPPPPPF